MCACTGPVGTGLCAVCVEDHGLNRTKKSGWTGWLVGLLVCLWQSKYEKGTLGAVCPILYEEPFFPWKTKKKKVFALARPVVIDPPPDLPVSLRNSAPPFRRPRSLLEKIAHILPTTASSFSPSFFSHTSTFQLLDKPWSQVSSLLPLGSCVQFLSRIGFSNPTARRFFHRVSPPPAALCCQRPAGWAASLLDNGQRALSYLSPSAHTPLDDASVSLDCFLRSWCSVHALHA